MARRAKLEQIERLNREGIERVGTLSDREFLMAGIALYAGDGSKRDGSVKFANSNPAIVSFFCRWLRTFFDVDESRLRIQLYLHEGLDLEAAVQHWRSVTGIPPAQFTKPYRASPDASIRHNKHEFGCAHVVYSCSRTIRAIKGLMGGLLGAPTEETD